MWIQDFEPNFSMEIKDFEPYFPWKIRILSLTLKKSGFWTGLSMENPEF